MATARAAKAKAASSGKKDAGAEVSLPSRREFLYYIWGASIVMVTGQFTAGLFFFALPRFKAGTFGGLFSVDGEFMPAVNAAPVKNAEGRFWLSNSDAGFIAIYAVCTHLGCLPNWVPTNFRFECPCHGSKYQITGKYIEGPAPRSLDRFLATIVFDDGTTLVTDPEGNGIPLPEGKKIARIDIDTGSRILRPGREQD